jgi:hypothetical protein
MSIKQPVVIKVVDLHLMDTAMKGASLLVQGAPEAL